MASARDLVGRWVHMFEEDTEQGAVYRRDNADVALSRRPRERLEINEDGTARMLVGGPDDRLKAIPGTWSAKAGEVIVRLEQPDSKSASVSAKEYRVVEHSADRLVIRQ
jgi:hypothetical protein